jgi:CHAT domain-containing protein
MEILHLDLKLTGDDYAQLSYFWDNPNNCQTRQLPLTEITALIQRSETDYYTLLPEDYAKTGQALYNWLDGSDRLLKIALNRYRQSGIVLAIAASKRLAHLPWEILHDGQSFLVERRPAIVPLRWVKNSNQEQLTWTEEKANRALNVLFMATSPLGVEPELDFEAEEAQILTGTQRRPLDLAVEESGCLKELGYLLEDYERGNFDVIHLTGHATFRHGEPCFVTETEYGEPEYSSANDIATELQFEMPPLIFLSGCRTGYSRAAIVPSMAEALLKQGATAVLAWGERVSDSQATDAAAVLYQELSAGQSLVEAIALTYQTLLKNQVPDRRADWHLLRLYVAETLPGALVERGRKSSPRRSTASKFLDPEGRVRVPTRENFVGRRRQLQNCLRTLKTDFDKVGVLIHGMGGLGKSAIVSRLGDRLPDYEMIVWHQQIDEARLVNRLADQLRISLQQTDLKRSEGELKYRLRNLFEQLNQPIRKPFLLVLDDFEWNLEPRTGSYILKPEVAEVLNALVWAVQESNGNHRILITCRYKIQSNLLSHFYEQGLDSFHKSDLKKKLRQLEHFNSGKVEENLINRALKLADGNPRLLEFMNEEVLSQKNVEEKLDKFEASPEDWKGKIIWADLYELIDEALQQILSYCLIYELSVPMAALEAVCDSLPDYKQQLQRGVGLGLIDMSPEAREVDRVYRVPRILPHIIPNIRLPEEPDVYFLYKKAHDKLHELWGNTENKSEEKWQEIFRLYLPTKKTQEDSDRDSSKC